MKRLATALVALLLVLSLLPATAASKRPPKLHLLHLQEGEVSTPFGAEGTWESEHQDIATVTKEGIITAVAEGYTLVLCRNKKEEVIIRCEVQVGEKPVPEEIEQVIERAISEWAEANNQAFPKYNKYTQWYNPGAKSGFGWCGAFVGYQFDEVGIQMDKEYRAKSAPPLTDGSLFAVKQASQTKLFEGFQSRNRLSNIPRPGYYIVYGRRGSTPYTHIGLVTAVQPLDDGKYILDTVEGNLNARIRRYQYIYDSQAERPDRNITSVPQEMQTAPDTYLYKYVDNFYINVFGQTWY
ncbi:MAG: CHAP domain-containing protein [Clostridiales bacterium]|nr:CHAP domain-containing protein [Clostridiales bacterium]